MRSVAGRIVDRHVLRLIKLWLKAPVEESDDDGRRRLTGGKSSTCGTPQGGVVSPLLANLYMNRFLKHWRATGRGEAYQARIISYADDFVILSRKSAAEALAWTRQVMTRLGLALNEAKTVVRDARREPFDFLGYTFGPHRYRKDGHWYLGASPSKKSVLRLKAKVSDLMVPGDMGTWPEVRDRLNRLLRGWTTYFSHGTRMPAYRAVDNHVYDQVRHFLVRRHAGFPDRVIPNDQQAARTLAGRTLTALYNNRPGWLVEAQRILDEAVAAAYGWPADIATDEALRRLLELNLARSAKERAVGKQGVAPPAPPPTPPGGAAAAVLDLAFAASLSAAKRRGRPRKQAAL
jgi:Reverse transcriptase (RNA-dependent DNA polymerase)/Group II intron, maturase-specific domain